eukprot:1807705-Amphidinium_carterae.1
MLGQNLCKYNSEDHTVTGIAIQPRLIQTDWKRCSCNRYITTSKYVVPDGWVSTRAFYLRGGFHLTALHSYKS